MRKRLTAVLAALAACGVILGCGSSGGSSGTAEEAKPAKLGESSAPEPTGDPVSGGTLVMDRMIEPESFDPIGTTDNGSLFAQVQVFDRLVELLPDSLEPQPGLAESWEVSPDGRTYTFNLRPGVQFSNGDPVTVDDVLFSLERFRSPADPYSFMVTAITSIESQSQNQIVVKLKTPLPSLLYALSLPAASIVPKDVYEELGSAKFGSEPVGSGAFVVRSFSRGQKLELERNPNYWREAEPYLDEVVMRYVPDDNARILDVTSGRADVAENIPYSQVAQVDGKPGVYVEVTPITGIEHIYLNNTTDELSDVRVRQALAYATPVQQLIESVYFGNVVPANNVIAPGAYIDDSVPSVPFDVEKAKELMEQAGYSDGFGLTLLIPGTDSTAKQLATILQSSWADIGVDLEIQQVADGNAVYAEITKGAYDAAYFGVDTADVPVEDELYPFLYYRAENGNNTGFPSSAKLEKLVEEAVTSTDEAERHELFSQVQTMGMEQLPFVPVAFATARVGVRDEVQNYQTTVSSWPRLEQVWLSGG
ncbi:MAG TPA: ABC transporter substrate-binding protein [Solirubrobacterales bacterium]|nr:ABC transporter substrate-binding protein [Solirubrobacterales bacterium]